MVMSYCGLAIVTACTSKSHAPHPHPQGFYAVYEGLFEKLARQEETAFERREERGRNNREFQYPARFGECLNRRCRLDSAGSCC